MLDVSFADLPTCLLCVCLTGSVYCEEISPDLTAVPTLPKETAYLYARFNKIKKISAKDFEDFGKCENRLSQFFWIVWNLDAKLLVIWHEFFWDSQLEINEIFDNSFLADNLKIFCYHDWRSRFKEPKMKHLSPKEVSHMCWLKKAVVMCLKWQRLRGFASWRKRTTCQ